MGKGEPFQSMVQADTYWKVLTEHARIVCDFLNTGYLLDEIAEMSEESEVRKQWTIVKDAMHNPHKPRPEGEWIGGEVMRQWVLGHLILNY